MSEIPGETAYFTCSACGGPIEPCYAPLPPADGETERVAEVIAPPRAAVTMERLLALESVIVAVRDLEYRMLQQRSPNSWTRLERELLERLRTSLEVLDGGSRATD
jgi:hypothetical protein